MQNFDAIIIGGGITGSSILRELSKYKLNILLLEKNLDIGSGVTKGNGGVVHSGYDAKNGTLKSKLNVIGASMYPQLSKELDFPYENKGTLTVAFNEEEMNTIDELLQNGLRNGVPNLRVLNQKELREIEPKVNPDAVGALYAPSAGITDPYEVAIAMAENAITNGATVKTNQKVIEINKEDNHYVVKTQDSIYSTRWLINASGVHGDTVSKLLGNHEYSMIERHGTLMIIEKAVGFELNATLFPVPGKDTKGMAAIPACAGNIILGSTATIMKDKETTRFTKDEASELFESASHLVPDLKRENIIRIFTGLRPVVEDRNNDFVIEEDKENPNVLHVIGIQSPGVASAPAIAVYVVDLMKEKETLEMKTDFISHRHNIPSFASSSVEQRKELIKKDPSYGHMICRCEMVTEAQILQAIHGKVPATTLDAVKRRTRAGMGRCQGGFCQPRIVEILHRELNIPYSDIVLEETGSQILEEQE